MSNDQIPAAPEATQITAPRPHTKAERLLDLLRTGTGASLEEMTNATGWQPHTVRAAMTGLRKRGFAITRHVEGNTTVWQVIAGEREMSA
jgi:predicted ArsR family transcriptional regulator